LTPAIALSGGALAKETLDAGFQAHLTKPPDVVRLIGLIRALVASETAPLSSR
jgi:hypothetical protein